MRRAVRVVLAVIALSPCPLLAQSSLFTAKVDADPGKEYLVTPEAGPWMVCAAHYSGPNGHELAQKMTYHLRSKEGLQAFMFEHVNEDQKKRADEREQRRQWQRQNGVPEDQLAPPLKVTSYWAVMVGGYPTDVAAKKALDAIKKLSPPELQLANGAPGTDTLLQAVPRPDRGGYELRAAPINPFANAFVTRNPAAKQEAATKDTAKEEQFLRSLNWGRPYSVYNCKKPWTLVVKDFGGVSVIQPRSNSGAFFNVLTLGKGPDLLDANAKQAEEVARVLRELKYDAYVLHRRYDSVVCVGAFDASDDPALLQMKDQITKLKFPGVLEFWANPAPMPVPK